MRRVALRRHCTNQTHWTRCRLNRT